MLRQSAGAINNRLFLFFYRNQYQLATDDAIYSDGDRYEPATAIVEHLKTFLPEVKNVLMLGSGIGSMVRVLHSKGFDPRCTLVEKDKVVLQWAMELFEGERNSNIEPVCSDAQAYMEQNTGKYDLIFIDIFDSRVVPDFVTTERFLDLCYYSLMPGGHLAMNYIINYKPDWDKVKQLLTKMYPEHHEIDLGMNRVLIV